MSLIDHAKMEFRAAGWVNDKDEWVDPMQKLICEQLIELIALFASHGHSGSSAPYAINLFEKLAKWEPIVPLTGEDWEWHEYEDGLFQNRRCGHVFKSKDRFDGQPYDSEAIIFWDWFTGEDGVKFKSNYMSKASAQVITFPYTPTRKYMEGTCE